MNRAELDDEISQVEQLLRIGVGALVRFQEPSGAYLRDTSGELRQQPPELDAKAEAHGEPTRTGATSTNRAVSALAEAYVALAEIDDRDDRQLVLRVRDQLARAAPLYLGRESLSDAVMKSKTNAENPFTTSHAFIASLQLHQLAQTTVGPEREPLLRIEKGLLDSVLEQIRSQVATWDAEIKQDGGLRIKNGADVHHFVTLAGVRAIDAITMFESTDGKIDPPKHLDRVEGQVTTMLAYDYSGIDGRFDPAELAFASAVLARGNRPLRERLVTRSVKSIVSAQHGDGSWSPARNVSQGDPRSLFIASYEVALALVDVLARDLLDDGALFELVAPAMRKLTSLIEGNYQPTPGERGWANDHVRSPDYVESWATAIVVSLLCRWRSALTAHRQNEILRRYHVEQGQPSRAERAWPDLARRLYRPTLKPVEVSDPTDEGKLADDLADVFIAPVLADPSLRPNNASFLMYGPAGSRKTSLLRALSAALGWPLVTLSPPDFLRDGLDGFERRAASVFSDLLAMQRVIVLFDECESFFLKRNEGTAGAEIRTQGAFITAGMLPRLQDLRDRRWVIFALATNAAPEALDPAVTREGRFDLHHEQSYPTIAAQIRYLRDSIAMAPVGSWNPTSDDIRHITEAAETSREKIAAANDGGGPVTFPILDDLARWLIPSGKVDAEKGAELVERWVARATEGPRRLTPQK